MNLNGYVLDFAWRTKSRWSHRDSPPRVEQFRGVESSNDGTILDNMQDCRHADTSPRACGEDYETLRIPLS